MTRTGWPIINPSLSLFLSPLPKRSIDGTMGNESMYPLVRNYVARNTTWNIGCNVDKYRATTMWTRGIIGKSNREVTFPIGSPRVPNVWQTIVLFSLASLTRIRTPPHSGIMYHRKINNFDRGDSSSRGKGAFRWINAVGKKSVGGGSVEKNLWEFKSRERTRMRGWGRDLRVGRARSAKHSGHPSSKPTSQLFLTGCNNNNSSQMAQVTDLPSLPSLPFPSPPSVPCVYRITSVLIRSNNRFDATYDSEITLLRKIWRRICRSRVKILSTDFRHTYHIPIVNCDIVAHSNHRNKIEGELFLVFTHPIATIRFPDHDHNCRKRRRCTLAVVAPFYDAFPAALPPLLSIIPLRNMPLLLSIVGIIL